VLAKSWQLDFSITCQVILQYFLLGIKKPTKYFYYLVGFFQLAEHC